MDKDFKRFFYKKTVVEEGDTIWLAWYLIDRERREGVHFHGIQYKDSYKPVTYEPWENNQYRFASHGIEKHSKTPLYEGQEPLKDCEVTGGDCYCDGTSLMARERLGHINPDSKNDDDTIWMTLHYFFRAWFEEEENNE